ncbi:MAG TPA: type II toxin-antitoxin system VapC family toxin [Candidatus Sulfotelmatobacter sp.]|nr:type II toxin-antitoxin system VapC family toxin [Candidatus Sulfotelmatobacter sp.]
MSKTYVLDASAVLSLLQNGPGASRMEQLLKEADRLSTPLLASVVNWGEVFYLSWQRHGEQSARETLADLAHLPIQVVPVELPQALRAGELKALHNIPYVDCIAAALAVEHGATLVTSDRDFERLGRQFSILWIARS